MTFVFRFCSLLALCINLEGFRTREMESEALDSNAGSLEEQVTSDLGIAYNYWSSVGPHFIIPRLLWNRYHHVGKRASQTLRYSSHVKYHNACKRSLWSYECATNANQWNRWKCVMSKAVNVTYVTESKTRWFWRQQLLNHPLQRLFLLRILMKTWGVRK